MRWNASVALIASLLFSSCAAAGEPLGPDAGSKHAGTACTQVVPLDDRRPVVVQIEPLNQVDAGLQRLHRLRQGNETCVQLALGVHAPPEVLLAVLRDVAQRRPRLLEDVAVIPLTEEAAARALVWYDGLEQRFSSLEAAAAAAHIFPHE